MARTEGVVVTFGACEGPVGEVEGTEAVEEGVAFGVGSAAQGERANMGRGFIG